MTVARSKSRTNCAHPNRVVRCAQLVRSATANCAHPIGALRAVRPVIGARASELTNCAHPPIPPRGACGQLAAAPELTARALEVRARSSNGRRYYQRENCPKGTWEQSPMATDFISRCRTRRGRHLDHDGRPRCAGGAGSPSRRELAKVGPLGGVVRQVPIASGAPRDDRGMTTPRESAAMHRMAESLLELLAAIEDGRVQREAERERDRQRAALATTRMHAPQPGKTEPLLVDAKEAARQLGIGIRTLHRLSAPRGPIPTVAIASRVLYAASDLKLIAVQRRLEQDDYGKDSPR